MYMAAPLYRNPYPGDHENYNLGRPYLGHHYNALNVTDLYLDRNKEIMHFHYLTYMATP